MVFLLRVPFCMLRLPHFIGPAPVEYVPFKSPGLQDRKVQHKRKKKKKTLLSRDRVICKPSGKSTAHSSLCNVRFSSETLQQGSITTALTHTHTHTQAHALSLFRESVLFPSRVGSRLSKMEHDAFTRGEGAGE